VFGGLYLPHLRAANYRHLLRAEREAVSALSPRRRPPAVQRLDFDADGREEMLLRSDHLGLALHPVGGAVILFEDRETDWNLQATLARRPEAYHQEMRAKAAERGEQVPEFVYDWHPRWSALDHFFGAETTLDAVADARHPEQGDFVTGAYDCQRAGRRVAAVVSRQGHVWVDDRWAPVTIGKTIGLAPDRAAVSVAYRITNCGDREARLWFGSEWNLALSGPRGEGRGYQIAGAATGLDLDARAEHHGLADLALADPWLGLSVRFHFGEPTDAWTFPVETISQGVETIDKVFQQSVVIPHWGITLAPGEAWEREFSLAVERLRP
jgi:alpha-amylase